MEKLGMESMETLLPMRLKSISIKNLDTLVQELVKDMRKEGIEEPPGGYTSEQLKGYFEEKKIFPPETFFKRNYFSPDNPHVTVTYMWPATPIEKFAELLTRRFDKNDTAYIDILLNDQRTKESIKIALRNAYIRCTEKIKQMNSFIRY